MEKRFQILKEDKDGNKVNIAVDSDQENMIQMVRILCAGDDLNDLSDIRLHPFIRP